MSFLPKYDVFDEHCPSRQLIELLSDKWTVLLLSALSGGTRRHAELQRTIQGISQKMLTQTLRSLERDGLVRRTVYPEVPPRVEYSLTPLGERLGEPVEALRRWAETCFTEISAARERFDAREPRRE